MANLETPNGAMPRSVTATKLAAMSATIMPAVMKASRVAVSVRCSGGETRGQRRKKTATTRIQGRNTSTRPVRKLAAPSMTRFGVNAAFGNTERPAIKPVSCCASQNEIRQNGEGGGGRHEQRPRVGVDAPRRRHHRERHAKTEDEQQKAPFGHDAETDDEPEGERLQRGRLVGIGEGCDPQRKARDQERKGM